MDQPLNMLNIISDETVYRNNSKGSDKNAWANSVDPDQPAPEGAVQSGSAPFAILLACYGYITG